MTRSTDGISNPRAATSVVRSTEGVTELVKRVKFFCRTLAGCFPCKGITVNSLPRINGIICWK